MDAPAILALRVDICKVLARCAVTLHLSLTRLSVESALLMGRKVVNVLLRSVAVLAVNRIVELAHLIELINVLLQVHVIFIEMVSAVLHELEVSVVELHEDRSTHNDQANIDPHEVS